MTLCQSSAAGRHGHSCRPQELCQTGKRRQLLTSRRSSDRWHHWPGMCGRDDNMDSVKSAGCETRKPDRHNDCFNSGPPATVSHLSTAVIHFGFKNVHCNVFSLSSHYTLAMHLMHKSSYFRCSKMVPCLLLGQQNCFLRYFQIFSYSMCEAARAKHVSLCYCYELVCKKQAI